MFAIGRQGSGPHNRTLMSDAGEAGGGSGRGSKVKLLIGNTVTCYNKIK